VFYMSTIYFFVCPVCVGVWNVRLICNKFAIIISYVDYYVALDCIKTNMYREGFQTFSLLYICITGILLCVPSIII
jgi:hypothetical protein